MVYLIGYLTIGCINFLWTSIVKMIRGDKELVVTVSRNDQVIMRELTTMNNVYRPIHAIVTIIFWPIILASVIYLRTKKNTNSREEES